MRKFIAGVLLGASVTALGAYYLMHESTLAGEYTQTELLDRYEAELQTCELWLRELIHNEEHE